MKIEINRMRNGYIIQILTSADIQEIAKIGGKVIEIYEGVIYRENFKTSPFKRVIDKLFALGQNYKDEGQVVMQILVKLIMNSLCGEFLRREILENYECKSELWIMTEYDERALDYQKNNESNYIVKMKDDAGLGGEVKKVNTLPLHLVAFILSTSTRIMNKFMHALNGFILREY